jgi:SNF2 family DNA or RNA helicase
MWLRTIKSTIDKGLFHKHTFGSIEKEKSKNMIEYNNKCLVFTEPERNIYNSHIQNERKYIDKNLLIKLCCHTELFNESKVLIEKCKSLDEIQKVILEQNIKKINSMKNDIKGYKKNEKNLIELLEIGDSELLKTRLTTVRRNITNDTKKIESMSRSVTFLENAIKVLEEEHVTCPICLDEIEDNKCITKCGHVFCDECITEAMRIKGKCPSCNQLVSSSEIYKLEKTVKKENESELDKVISKVKSTKIGNIIYYLTNELKENDKCIIFSQWDYLLDKVRELVSEYLRTVSCKGNVYQRKHAIDEFTKNKEVKLILLSSKNCASGINLTEANKIIFLEPIYGDTEYRTTTEIQAIGRANRITQQRNITVLRFYIKDTVEEELIETI